MFDFKVNNIFIRSTLEVLQSIILLYISKSRYINELNKHITIGDTNEKHSWASSHFDDY